MRNALYRQMVCLINEQCSWIRATQSNLYKRHILFPRFRPWMPCVCRTLVLKALCNKGWCRKGMEWHISEYELDRALALHRKRDPYFRVRIASGAHRLMTRDVETIIELATHGMVKLNLRFITTQYPYI